MSEEQRRDTLPEAARESHRDGEPRRPPPVDPLKALTALDPEGPPAEIPLEKLDFDALKVVQRLRSYGHQAYLVGGCVRDLLLGHQPKDFDVATSAHPGEIRAIFRNCRLIGRRFRLAHVYFRGGKVVETATFRANPNAELTPEQSSGDLLITHDNVFGTAEEDARRRDFTINGLFYDVVLGRVIDYVDGRPDLDNREIRTIGDPGVRMREDPVRILRAVRFAAKLDLRIEENTWQAMREHAGELARCAPPRVLEEIFRLLRCGYARRCFELLDKLGALSVLLPPLQKFLQEAPPDEAKALFESLGLLDEVVRKGPLPDDAVLLSTLLIHLSKGELVRHQPQQPAAPAPGPTLGPSLEGAPEEHAIVEATPPAPMAEGGVVEEEVEDSEELIEIEAIEQEADESAPLPPEPEETPQVPWSISANAENVEELLAELVRSARLPRRIAERARLVLHAQRILSGVRKRRSSPVKFLRQPFFPDALLVFELYVKATGHGKDAFQRWRSRWLQLLEEQKAQGQVLADPAVEILAAEVAAERGAPVEAQPAAAAAAAAEAPAGEGKGRRRRRGGRRRKGHREEVVDDGETAAAAPNVVAAAPASNMPESLPSEAERRLPPGPADFLPF